MNQERSGTRILHWAQPHMLEFLDVAEAPVEPSQIPESERASHDMGAKRRNVDRQGWFGNVSFAQAVSMARSGWPDGARMVQELSASISAPLLRQLERVAAFDVAPADWIDPDRLLSGQPEVWGQIVDGESLIDQARGKCVHIVVHGGMSCRQCGSMNCMTEPVGAATLMNRGAMICSFIDVMEALGVRCKVTLVCACTGLAEGPGKQPISGAAIRGDNYGWGDKDAVNSFLKNYGFAGGAKDARHAVVNRRYDGDRIAFSLTIKDYHDALDLDSLIFAIGHVAFIRRLAFSYLEHMEEDVKIGFRLINCGAEPGTYAKITDDLPEQLRLSGDGLGESVVYFPSIKGDPPEFASMDLARAQCHELLKKQGVVMRHLEAV